MKKIAVIVGALASVIAASSANAAVRLYTISNGAFDDGTAFGGSFGYDAATGAYSNANIVVQSGAATAFKYDSSAIPFRNYFSTNSVMFFSQSGGRSINLAFSGSLASTNGAISLRLNSPNLAGSFETIGTWSPRAVTSGSVSLNTIAAVPEPATWAMLVLGFGIIGYAMRRKTVLRYV